MPNHVTNQIKFYGEQENINQVLNLINGEDRCIDFEKLIPMPKELKLPSGSITTMSIRYALSKKEPQEKYQIEKVFTDTHDSFYGNYYKNVFAHTVDNSRMEEQVQHFEDNLKNETRDMFDETDYQALGINSFEDLGNAYIKNIQQYGYDTWYDWCCAKWGTKWNAYDDNFDKEENVITFDTAWSCPIPVLCELAKLCNKYNVKFDGAWADEDTGCNVGTFDSDEDQLYHNYAADNSNEAYEIYVELKGESCTLHKDDNGNWVYHGCENCPHPC